MPFAALEENEAMAEQKKQETVMDEGAIYVLRSGTPIYIKMADICAMTASNQ